MKRWAGWIIFALSVMLGASSIALASFNGRSFFDDSESLAAVAFLSFGFVGALVTHRFPSHKLGHLFAAISLSSVLASATDDYARAALTRAERLPGYVAAAWIQNWIWFLPLGLVFTFGILLFPDGRLPNPRWRAVGWLAAVGLLGFSANMALTEGPLDGFPTLQNPMGVLADSPLSLVFFLGIVLAALASVVSMFVRFRNGDSIERAQLKYVTLSVTVGLGTLLVMPYVPVDIGESGSDILFGLMIALFPVACGISILKYRLFDIDVIVNRALVYGSLTAILAGAYLAIVFALQQVLPLGQRSDFVVAASTLAVAGLFRPVRGRVQSFIDRRFFRRKYDAASTIESFAARLRSEVALEEVERDVLETLRATMAPAHASLWMRDAV